MKRCKVEHSNFTG